MGRKAKVTLAVVVLLILLLGVNTLVTSGETRGPEVTVPGGRILSLPGGDLQVVDRGPRDGSPIVLIHCFTCSINWWDRMIPRLEREHRVVAIDLLGHGGSEKPDSNYAMEAQAALVAAALRELGVRGATVVGHSLGGIVATALSETSPGLTDRVVIVGQAPVNDGYGADLPFTTALTFTPVIGEALWRTMPDSAIEEGLEVAFAPGYDVPSEVVDDFRRLTYTSYDESPQAEDAYTNASPLDQRLRKAGVPLLVIFGAEEQIYDPEEAVGAYAAIGGETELIPGAGHSPNVERPARTAALVLAFSKKGRPNGRPK